MARVTEENLFIANRLGIDFETDELKLGKWGNVDFYCQRDNVLVLLEVEKGQKHPNTNVIKVWPYLEENPEIKILLIQIIREENKAPKNRIALCKYMGKKIESQFPNRFRFVFRNWHNVLALEIKEQVQYKLKELT
ncbi:hypothetical protein CLV86_2831 [Lacinutrix venerupis]|uniref:hypothetical protein n=1 Tax=Lacinutrix venerupis TaxID=1486034 RepID=UPI000EAD3C36|nr:hypothetical protein [Lacinutrix venerupis]RLJ60770.1 hypothetical protein CLV86_2831 [Lacinutrix venerupis]